MTGFFWNLIALRYDILKIKLEHIHIKKAWADQDGGDRVDLPPPKSNQIGKYDIVYYSV